MQKIRLILAGVSLSLAFSACLKQDNEPRGMTDSGYRLTGINWSDERAVRFRYDGDNRIERIEYGRGRYSNGTLDLLDSYYEYKYRRGRCNQVFYRCPCDSDGRWRTFVYDDDGRIRLAESHLADGTFTSFTRYRYDGAGRLVEARDSASSVVTERIFNYGAGDNLRSMTLFRHGMNGTTKERREWTRYDTQHSYIHEIPGLPLDDPNLGVMRGYISWTNNNYLGERVYPAVPENDPQTFYIETLLGFRYDQNGLPVELNTGTLQWKFTYEQY